MTVGWLAAKQPPTPSIVQERGIFQGVHVGSVGSGMCVCVCKGAGRCSPRFWQRKYPCHAANFASQVPCTEEKKLRLVVFKLLCKEIQFILLQTFLFSGYSVPSYTFSASHLFTQGCTGDGVGGGWEGPPIWLPELLWVIHTESWQSSLCSKWLIKQAFA